jgi:hypothetical protein
MESPQIGDGCAACVNLGASDAEGGESPQSIGGSATQVSHRRAPFELTRLNKRQVDATSEEEDVGIRRILFSLTFAAALLALASSGASAFVYSSFVCQAVGMRSVDWGRSFFVGDAKMIALSRCARRSGICTISYCVPGY